MLMLASGPNRKRRDLGILGLCGADVLSIRQRFTHVHAELVLIPMVIRHYLPRMSMQ
jgi:hypothetical protein